MNREGGGGGCNGRAEGSTTTSTSRRTVPASGGGGSGSSEGDLMENAELVETGRKDGEDPETMSAVTRHHLAVVIHAQVCAPAVLFFPFIERVGSVPVLLSVSCKSAGRLAGKEGGRGGEEKLREDERGDVYLAKIG